MKILVTGGTGFIGRYVINELQQQGIDFVSLQKMHAKDNQSVELDLLSNCNDIKCVIEEIKPTHLIHMAWYTEHGKYWDSDLNIQWIAATKSLVEAFCAAGGQHLVITGTCAEYDWTHGYCIEDVTPINPNSLYGISKDATRKMVELITERYGVSMSWARVFFPYGPGESSQRLIPSLFRALSGQIPPFGVNGSSYRDLLYVTDAAKGILACLQSEVTGSINICSGTPVQIWDIVEIIAAITRSNASKILDKQLLKNEKHRFLIGDNEKLIKLGWKQEVMLSEGLRFCNH